VESFATPAIKFVGKSFLLDILIVAAKFFGAQAITKRFVLLGSRCASDKKAAQYFVASCRPGLCNALLQS
jgi:hypothetical protein